MELQRIGDTAKKSTYVVGKSSTDTALSEDVFTQEVQSSREKPATPPKIEDSVDSNKISVNGTSESSTPTNQSPKKSNSRRSSAGSRHSSEGEETNIDATKSGDAKISKESLREVELSSNKDEDESESKTNSRQSGEDFESDNRGEGDETSRNATEDLRDEEKTDEVSIVSSVQINQNI